MFVFRMLAIAALLGSATAARAATFTVTNTNTSGAGSLHQAILDANVDATADLIQFAIAGGGVKVIAGDLPAITKPVTIDGYTQPATSVNTLAGAATNANLRIVLEGSALEATENVLDVEAGPTTIRGLVINKMKAKGAGIAVADGVTGVVVKGCFLGTSTTGSASDSAGIGVLVDGTATIGTPAPADRNLISGNAGAGVLLRGSGSLVQNNLIGCDAGGTPELGNGTGVQLGAGAVQNIIGGIGSSAGNEIAGNENEGIVLLGTAGGGNSIESNRIHSNGELGIDLGNDGVTDNDSLDFDGGPNGLQNFPEIAHARLNGGVLHVEGVLFGRPGEYRIDLFTSASPDASGFGEGEEHVDSLSVEIPGGETAVAFLNETNLAQFIVEDVFVSATATNLTELGTSEFSRAVEAFVGGTELVVTNTNDTGGGSLRAALAAAGADAGPNTILFDIPGDGPHTIALESGISADDSPLVVDGYSQPGSSLNTSAFGTNAGLQISIDGSNTTVAVLSLFGTRAIIRGLNIHSGAGHGVRFVGTEDAQVEGCFIGTDVSGLVAAGNDDDGISTGESQRSRIGGFSRANRNLVSANGSSGISDLATGSTILNNLVGVDATEEGLLGNGNGGILASGTKAKIGSDEDDAGNVIRGNELGGVLVLSDSSSVMLLGNDVSQNDGLGIDLVEIGVNDFGVTPNDVDDADVGANGLQNFPVLTDFTRNEGSITLTGSLDVPADRLNSVYRLRFFTGESCDPSGHGEGERFLTAVNVLIPNDEEFVLQLPVRIVDGTVLTATAEDPETGNSSEFSECFEVGGGGEPDVLCGDGSLNEEIAAGDALIVLRTAVGADDCDACVCDVNDNGSIQSSDALSVLRSAVGQEIELVCPKCEAK